MNDDFWVNKLKLRKICMLPLNLTEDEKIIFVADVHLSTSNKHKNEIFARFLKTLDSSAKAVFIIGDLFDFFIGSPQEREEIYAPVFAETLRLKNNGTMLFFLPGNRDFFVFNALSDFGIENLPLWTKLEVSLNGYSRRILLTHGDNLMISLRNYRFYSNLIRSGISYRILNTTSYKTRVKIGHFLRRTLSSKYKAHYELNECFTDFSFVHPDFIKAFEYPLMSDIADVMILGHWHLKANIDLNPGKIFIIGDWRDNAGAFIEFKNGHFFHEVFM